MSKKSTPSTPGDEDRIVVFQEQAIRRTWHGQEWWFSVIDVVGVLSESRNDNRYWSDLKRKLAQEAGPGQPYEKIVRLKLTAPDGKQRETELASARARELCVAKGYPKDWMRKWMKQYLKELAV